MAGLVLLLNGAGCTRGGTPTEYGVVTNNDFSTVPEDVKWVNVAPGPFIWGDVQRRPDQLSKDWSWGETDSVIVQANEQQLYLVVTLWPYALWDQAECHGDWPSVISLLGEHFAAPYVPCDAEAYQSWVQAVVERYGDSVTVWQIMRFPEQQEPPFAHFIGSAQEYASLSKKTAQAIRTIQPDATILSGTIGKPTSSTISFWGPMLEDDPSETFTTLAVTAADVNEWESVQTWIARYTWEGPIWILHTPTQQSFEGAEKVFYTSIDD